MNAAQSTLDYQWDVAREQASCFLQNWTNVWFHLPVFTIFGEIRKAGKSMGTNIRYRIFESIHYGLEESVKE